VTTQWEVDENRAIAILGQTVRDQANPITVRVAACHALGSYMPDRRVVNELASELQRQVIPEQVRAAAALALGRVSPRQETEVMFKVGESYKFFSAEPGGHESFLVWTVAEINLPLLKLTSDHEGPIILNTSSAHFIRAEHLTAQQQD
jgi:hypothetical protein